MGLVRGFAKDSMLLLATSDWQFIVQGCDTVLLKGYTERGARAAQRAYSVRN